MTDPLNIDEYEVLAREALPQMAYDYIAGGADDEITVAENRLAFRRRALRYRVLIDVSERDLSTELLGIRLPFPIIVAPTAAQKLAHPDGEAATAAAASSLGALMTLSSLSTVPMEEIAATGVPRWFQLYCYAGPDHTEQLVKRAHAADYQAIVLTVDLPVVGRRERDLRNPFAFPEGFSYAHFEAHPPQPDEGSQLAAMVNRPDSTFISWDNVSWLRSLSPLPMIIKGVVRGDDARRAVEAGFDAIWVSNHGGRQLDGSIATADALPEIVDAVNRQVPIIVDGGIRRGTDVLKALAMGANAVAVGRPPLWGLTVGGQDGVRRVLELLRDELSMAMALAGCPTIADIDRSLLA
jgi:4-hydroxymandelate oxidase